MSSSFNAPHICYPDIWIPNHRVPISIPGVPPNLYFPLKLPTPSTDQLKAFQVKFEVSGNTLKEVLQKEQTSFLEHEALGIHESLIAVIHPDQLGAQPCICIFGVWILLPRGQTY